MGWGRRVTHFWWDRERFTLLHDILCSLMAQDIRVRLATELAKIVAADSLESDVELVSLDTKLQVVGVMISRGQLGLVTVSSSTKAPYMSEVGFQVCCCCCYY